MAKPTFSGHDKFQCRHLWLKKGYDFVKSGKSFSSDNAVISLGVGKNMVSAIRHWLRAFDVINEEDDSLTEFGHKMFSDDGWDPYLEDDASLWVLHYKIVKKGYATLYTEMFNEFRKQKLEFNKDNFWQFVKFKYSDNSAFRNTQNTVGNDFVVFIRQYLADVKAKNKEDIISGILTELGLVRTVGKNQFTIEAGERVEMPDEVIMYAISDNSEYGKSVAFQTLLSDIDSPGSIFAFNQKGLYDKIETIAARHSKLVVFKDDAGVQELQFKKEKPEPFQILDLYYQNAN